MPRGSDDELSPSGLTPPTISSRPIELSIIEQEQLGTERLLRNGKLSAHQWPSREQWPALRQLLVERSIKSNPKLQNSRDLIAYTPGETLGLLDHPTIRDWHKREAVARIDSDAPTIVLVPCAKTKPWVGKAIRRSKLYSAYNQLREERDDLVFATISEPLGIVPEKHWGDFPQYDNPGLFHDDAQRSGMTLQQWRSEGYEHALSIPFDEEAWQECINRLGVVVGEFLTANADRRFIAFVDNPTGSQSTHGAMLDVAERESGVKVERHAKRGQARVSPLGYLRDMLPAE